MRRPRQRSTLFPYTTLFRSEIADAAKVGLAEFFKLAWHNPALGPDLSRQTDEQRAAFAANQRTLMVYAGDPYCHDPKLRDRKSTRLNSSHLVISYAVFCLKK